MWVQHSAEMVPEQQASECVMAIKWYWRRGLSILFI
jgi:hypothetical protein